jgi:hypothetical protein
MDVLEKQARRDLNPQPPDLESGALAVRATGPSHGLETVPLIACSTTGRALLALPCFSVNCMLSAKATILLALEPIGGGTFVLHGGVISLSTTVTC